MTGTMSDVCKENEQQFIKVVTMKDDILKTYESMFYIVQI